MHPPFFTVSEPSRPFEVRPRPARSIPRRSQPERLHFTVVPVAGWPPVPVPEPPVSLAEIARTLRPPAPARRGLRARVGLWLIRVGERLADPPRPA